ncbi:MAG: DNA replication/repair protein RecF [Anaerolineae bacterium]|nr:DNA replication/repair protein RecF [Anaerolineae bacterium]
MHLTHISLTDFRSFSRLDMDVPRRILLLVGANAQGKTSLLEAIYYMATFTSFHAQNDRQLVNFIAAREPMAVARLVIAYQRGTSQHRLEVRLIHENLANGSSRLRKEILQDGVKRAVHEALGHFNAVIFLPQMTRIFEGGPEERRRYLNLMICQANPAYARALSEYQQALTQRNALLKQLFERKGDPDQLIYWDDILTRRGATIIMGRVEAVEEMEKHASRLHHQLSHTQEVLRLSYQPSYDPAGKPREQFALPLDVPVKRNGFTWEDVRQGFAERLLTLRSEEIYRGVTTVGPHRDDLSFLSNGVNLEHYGSRGQIRTALLSLKIAEVSWLKEKTGHDPVLLLDEILAELDIQRRADLLKILEQSEQAILTTTDLNLFAPDFVSKNTVWNVAGGRIMDKPEIPQ